MSSPLKMMFKIIGDMFLDETSARGTLNDVRGIAPK